VSIWDQVKKPAKLSLVATAITISKDKREVAMTWSDGAQTVVAARRLRQYCPCAGCVDEWTNNRTFDVETIPQDMTVLGAEAVGNYALSFTFGDDHRTGIFQWAYLRDLSTLAKS